MSVRIIVDSTADLLPEIRERVSIVPLTVHFGDEQYLDGMTITHREFYEKLLSSDELPKTSQATPVTFEKVFRQITEKGDTAVVLTMAQKLSGTYQSACIAAEDYPGIFVVDSATTTIGLSILTELALSLADSGMEAEAVAARLNQEKNDIQILAIFDTLEFLKRGGRISAAAAFTGGLLNIKPVLSIADGQIQTIGKARGPKLGNKLLAEEIQKAGGIDFSRPVLLGYTGLSDSRLLNFMEDWEHNSPDLRYTSIGSVVGTHAGPDAFAVAFFKK